MTETSRQSKRAWGPYLLIGSGLVLLAIVNLWYWGGTAGVTAQAGYDAADVVYDQPVHGIHEMGPAAQQPPFLPKDSPQPHIELPVDFHDLGIVPPEAAPAAAEVPARDSRLPIFILGVALSLAMIGSGVIWWRRDGRPQTVTLPAARDSGGSEELDAVLASIAELDNAYEAGSIDEAEYQERHARLREQAVDLMMKQS